MDFRKLINIIEGASGYIAKDSKEAKDPRFSTGLTKDVKPGEIDRQAAKFGNEFPPPLLHSKAAKNSTPNKLMNLGLNEDSVSDLKKAVIKQVNATDDAVMLDRIYTVLNKSNLQDRIQGVISKETDAKKYSDVIADIIINTPGTYKEKYDFIEGYPDGYVDVNKLISGQLVNFRDLITGNEFSKKVFEALFAFTPESAGPGEFALAALSPHIRMRPKGDLYINDEYIEVKTSAGKKVSSGGGRLGEPGLLNHVGIKEIIEKYTKKKVVPDLYIQQLHDVLSMSIKDPKTMKAAATEIVKNIFGHTDANLINAITSNGNAQQAYLNANWQKYKEEAGWVGLLIMNLSGRSVRYFTKPEQMAGSLYSLNAILVSKDAAKASRQILSQVTLNPGTERTRTPRPDNTDISKMSDPIGSAAAAPRTKRQPVDISAAKPKLKSAPADVGRTKRK